MNQVYLNLILNAIQAMTDGGRLTIATRKRNERHGARIAEIRFSDTGCGIPSENLSKIFDPFFTTKNIGTGLGLTIVHNITRVHGGSVDISSSPGYGANCIVSFPLRPHTTFDKHNEQTERV